MSGARDDETPIKHHRVCNLLQCDANLAEDRAKLQRLTLMPDMLKRGVLERAE